MADKTLSPLKSIKKRCLEQCCCGDRKSWKECNVYHCFLWPWRFSKRKPLSKHNPKDSFVSNGVFEENKDIQEGTI